MNKYLKSFLFRGLVFGGFGPIILGIIYLIISVQIDNFTISGSDVFIGIISVYLLAFVHAGVSVFNTIEHWSILKSLICHFSTLYISYLTCYLINSWLDFNLLAVIIFTIVFISIYFVIWVIVVSIIKINAKKLNKIIN